MNEHFYAVKFDAETLDTITFQGQQYVGFVREDGKKGSHRLARTLLNGRMSYPSYVIMNEEMRTLQVIGGIQVTMGTQLSLLCVPPLRSVPELFMARKTAGSQKSQR
jgi:hypothetical protein